MQNEPNFPKSQMFITLISTMNYNEKLTMDTWSKRTQTKPILKGALVFLFNVNNAASAVGIETGFLDDVVEFAGVSYLFKSEFRVRFIGCDYYYRAYADDTVEQASVKFQVNNSKHIQIVHFSAENPPAPLDSVGGDFVAGRFEPGHLCQKYEHNEHRKAKTGNNPIPAE